MRLEHDAVELCAAGLALLILELIPEEVATRITKAVPTPTIGIGAGRGTDGQVLVIHDILGLTKVGYRHNRRFAELGSVVRDAPEPSRPRCATGAFLPRTTSSPCRKPNWS